MSIVWADVLNIAPELSSVPVGAQTVFLNHVNTNLGSADWGSNFTLAASYLAAHLATVTMRGGDGPTGGVTGESAGQVARQYANPSKAVGNPGYQASSYGRMFVLMCRQQPAGFGFVT